MRIYLDVWNHFASLASSSSLFSTSYVRVSDPTRTIPHKNGRDSIYSSLLELQSYSHNPLTLIIDKGPIGSNHADLEADAPGD